MTNDQSLRVFQDEGNGLFDGSDASLSTAVWAPVAGVNVAAFSFSPGLMLTAGAAPVVLHVVDRMDSLSLENQTVSVSGAPPLMALPDLAGSGFSAMAGGSMTFKSSRLIGGLKAGPPTPSLTPGATYTLMTVTLNAQGAPLEGVTLDRVKVVSVGGGVGPLTNLTFYRDGGDGSWDNADTALAGLTLGVQSVMLAEKITAPTAYHVRGTVSLSAAAGPIQWTLSSVTVRSPALLSLTWPISPGSVTLVDDTPGNTLTLNAASAALPNLTATGEGEVLRLTLTTNGTATLLGLTLSLTGDAQVRDFSLIQVSLEGGGVVWTRSDVSGLLSASGGSLLPIPLFSPVGVAAGGARVLTVRITPHHLTEGKVVRLTLNQAQVWVNGTTTVDPLAFGSAGITLRNTVSAIDTTTDNINNPVLGPDPIVPIGAGQSQPCGWLAFYGSSGSTYSILSQIRVSLFRGNALGVARVRLLEGIGSTGRMLSHATLNADNSATLVLSHYGFYLSSGLDAYFQLMLDASDSPFLSSLLYLNVSSAAPLPPDTMAYSSGERFIGQMRAQLGNLPNAPLFGVAGGLTASLPLTPLTLGQSYTFMSFTLGLQNPPLSQVTWGQLYLLESTGTEPLAGLTLYKDTGNGGWDGSDLPLASWTLTHGLGEMSTPFAETLTGSGTYHVRGAIGTAAASGARIALSMGSPSGLIAPKAVPDSETPWLGPRTSGVGTLVNVTASVLTIYSTGRKSSRRDSSLMKPCRSWNASSKSNPIMKGGRSSRRSFNGGRRPRKSAAGRSSSGCAKQTGRTVRGICVRPPSCINKPWSWIITTPPSVGKSTTSAANSADSPS